jgi:methyltransferase-like protein/trans-aconitate methyltransferase
MSTEAEATTPYDEVLYPAAVFPLTHPNRLATVAYLRGVNPAPASHCRVFELGCGVGSNLTPMACHLPESEFIGIDLARRPIASGKSFINELGLQNIQLHAMDIRDASRARFGTFDYMIAHGVYSWVAQPVRERILAICSEMLNPHGVAYISYNAYPGNHLRDLVRTMMRFHTSPIKDFSEKVGQARGIVKFVAESATKPDYYVAAVRAQFDRISKYADEGFFHDDLSDINQSFYFYEFSSDAERHGLQFVGEAGTNVLQPDRFTNQVMDRMAELQAAPEVVREQYKDFIRGTAFRQTLLCHEELNLAPDILIDRIPKLYVSCDAKLQKTEGDSGSKTTRFVRHDGSELETAHPLIVEALSILSSNWPCEIHFERLLNEASGKATGVEENDKSWTLAEALSRAYRTGFLHLHVAPHRLTNAVSRYPAVSKLVRVQLASGETVTNQLHVAMKFRDRLSRRLVELLDGTRDQEALTHELVEFVRNGHAELIDNGVPVRDLNAVEAILKRRVREGLVSLAQEAMLVS